MTVAAPSHHGPDRANACDIFGSKQLDALTAEV